MRLKTINRGAGERKQQSEYFLPAERHKGTSIFLSRCSAKKNWSLAAFRQVLGFKTLTLLLTLCLVVPGAVRAEIVVTEIMYDLPTGSDAGREWIEVYNSGPTTVDLSALRLFENGTNHKISGAGTLAPNMYAVIADNPTKFKIDWPQYYGLLFDSAFTLGNDGDSIELRDASSTVHSAATFTKSLGAAGDGNSLNKEPSGSTFAPRTPTPGAMMSQDVVAPKTKSVVEQKVVQKETDTTAVPEKEDSTIANTPVEVSDVSQVAAAVVASDDATPPWQWWLAAGLLASSTAGAIIFARRFAKDEWDIVEEN